MNDDLRLGEGAMGKKGEIAIYETLITKGRMGARRVS